jgi:thiamine kinase-like enzyme
MLAADLLPALESYLATPAVRASLGIARGADVQLAFLAQGEYNINYLVISDDRRLVVRVNVGTQIGKPGGEQIAYEAAALELLGPHGVAPRLHYIDDSLAVLPYGLLAMEFLPGQPLRYDDPAQIAAAAQTLARLHQVPAPESLFIRRRALIDDLAEARGWLASYLECDRVPALLHACFARILQRAEADAERYAGRFPAPFALVHTDVQAHNFMVKDERPKTNDESDPETPESSSVAASHPSSFVLRPSSLVCRLVDWERPLIDDPTYDLAHFLIPTTTRWKCGYTFSAEEHEHFLASYCAARPDLDPADIRERLRLRRPFILLRALSWCAGAWVEYTGPGRMIDNQDTLRKIEEYLVPDELASLFPEWLGDS